MLAGENEERDGDASGRCQWSSPRSVDRAVRETKSAACCGMIRLELIDVMANPVHSDDHRFRRKERLRLRDDFGRVYALRCSRGDRVLVVYAAPNDLGLSRLGLSVSRRVGRAVDRNYVRRRIREAFRLNKRDLPVGYDFVCVARSCAADRSVDVAKSLCALAVSAVQRFRSRNPKDKDRSGAGTPTTTPAPARRNPRT